MEGIIKTALKPCETHCSCWVLVSWLQKGTAAASCGGGGGGRHIGGGGGYDKHLTSILQPPSFWVLGFRVLVAKYSLGVHGTGGGGSW